MPAFLRLLGGARMETAGVPVRGRAAHRRRLALLTLLATAPSHRLSRERIIAYLWPQHDSEGGRRLLSEALHVIRKELGDDSIATIGDELALNPEAVGSDVAEFRAAVAAGEIERAVEVYGGPFLDGWYVTQAREFDEWAEHERAELAAAYAGALEKLAKRCEDAGDWAGAVDRWRERGRLNPDNSRPVLHLARALVASGERAAAIKAFAAHVKYMESEELPVDADVLAYDARLRDESLDWAAERERIGGRPHVATQGDGGHQGGSAAPTSGTHAPTASAGGKEAGEAGVRQSETEPVIHSSYTEPLAPSRIENAGSSARRWWTPGSRKRALLAGAALASLATAVLVWRSSRDGPDDPPTTSTAYGATGPDLSTLDPTRIAVLYLEDISEHGQGRHIADGITEELIHQLGGVGTLQVASRSAVRQFRGDVPFERIVTVLQVGSVVGGSVQVSGDRIRVRVHLTDTRTRMLAGSKVFERPLTELFELEDEISRQVAIFLRRQVGEEIRLRASRSGTTNVRAQELMLKAERVRKDADSLKAYGSARDVRTVTAVLRQADTLLARAEQEDSRWTDPVIARGWVHHDMAMLERGDATLLPLRLALGHAERAVRLDSANARALELRGAVRWRIALAGPATPGTPANVRDAERDLAAALMLDSNLASAWATYSQMARAAGQADVANERARRAYRADAYLALAGGTVSQLYRSFVQLALADSAQAWCDRGKEMDPSNWRFVECELLIMRLDLARADPRRAWAIVAELDSMDPPDRARDAGHAYQPTFRRLVAAAVSARRGQRERARAELARALGDLSGDPDMYDDAKYDRAFLHFALGERTQGLQLLREYFAAHPDRVTLVARDPAFRQFGLDSATIARLRGTSRVE